MDFKLTCDSNVLFKISLNTRPREVKLCAIVLGVVVVTNVVVVVVGIVVVVIISGTEVLLLLRGGNLVGIVLDKKSLTYGRRLE